MLGPDGSAEGSSGSLPFVMEVDLEAEEDPEPLPPRPDHREALSQLRIVLPHVELESLERALVVSDGDVERALNRLLEEASAPRPSSALQEPPDVQVDLTSSQDEVVVPPVAAPAARRAPPPPRSLCEACRLVEVLYDKQFYWARLLRHPADDEPRYRVSYLVDDSYEDVDHDRIHAYWPGDGVEVDEHNVWDYRRAEIVGSEGDNFLVCFEEDGREAQVHSYRVKSKEQVAVEKRFQAVLPDCEPNHFHKILHDHENEEAAMEQLLSIGYPKRQKRQAGGSSSSSSKPAWSMDQPPGDLAAEFWFNADRRSKEDAHVGKHWYKTEAQRLLLDEFKELSKSGIRDALEKAGGFYAVAWKMCYEAVSEILAGRKPKAPLKVLQCPRKAAESCKPQWRMKKEMDFIRWWRNKQHAEQERAKRQEAYRKECEARGLVLECECCFAEHVAEETVQCAAGHLFCTGCMRRHVETQMSGDSGMPRLVCFSTSGCQEQLPRSELARVLPESLLTSFDQRLEKASIEAAMLQGSTGGLEKCPFCDFVMVMESSPEENKIFVCMAAECGKESCRLCKEENHLPLRCHEVEKKPQMDHRKMVEESMANALIRECLACKAKGITSRFVKTDGCNKMTCPKCRGWICYHCNAMIAQKESYLHFCQHPLEPGKACTKCKKCPLWTYSGGKQDKEEAARVARAGQEADAQYRRDHTADEVAEKLDVLNGAQATRSSKKRHASRGPDEGRRHHHRRREEW